MSMIELRRGGTPPGQGTWIADRSDDDWMALNKQFFGNNHGASGSKQQLTDLLALAGITTDGRNYREVRALFTLVRDYVSERSSRAINQKMALGFLKAMGGQ